jgi:hypothetical protein
MEYHSRYVEETVLFSKASRRVLWFTQPPVRAHRATSSVRHEVYVSVPRLKCVKPYLQFAIRILTLCLIPRGMPLLFSQLLAAFLMGISRSHISSTYHVVLRITSLLSSSLDGRSSTVAVRRGGYTSL